MAKGKQLSNPFSTGGGGANFEAHVQASFVALMLTDGHAPCLPCWPIVEVKLQGKVDGFDTDDLIVTVESPSTNEKYRLLGQIKHSIEITANNSIFGEVIQAAWSDFNRQSFSSGKDAIALITGPISKTDSEVAWLLNHARANANDHERFFNNVQLGLFSSKTKQQKLEAIKQQLKKANNGIELKDETFFRFLKNFYLLGYDLGEEEGVVLSLINSHISQFNPDSSRLIWSRIRELTSNFNQHAGLITKNNLPQDLIDAFSIKPKINIPVSFASDQSSSTNWENHQDATYLALATLLGSWQDQCSADHSALTQLLNIPYEIWINKARDILQYPDSPLSLKNGTWKVENKVELWKKLGSRVFDQDLDNFKNLATSTLTELDPAFDLPIEERYAARVHGKIFAHSDSLRSGITEGLAILASQEIEANWSPGKAEITCVNVIHNILNKAEGIQWGSLNNLLPNLAEAAPNEFLNCVEQALSMSPCPFSQLYEQESNGFTGTNYMTGLLWALEILAWVPELLIRSCIALSDLANIDPGGRWSNRPSESLITILLPWMPQTLAPIDKRKVAVQTILQESPVVGWKLLINLLPGQHQTTLGSHKPSWRNIFPENWKESVSNQEYWKQVDFYADLAIESAKDNASKLSSLIKRIDKLPKASFEKILNTLKTDLVLTLPEEQRLLLWSVLTGFVRKHRRYPNTKWALPESLLIQIEGVAEPLTPTKAFNLYQNLFSGNDFDLYEENGDWDKQREKLSQQRDAAIYKIFENNGISGVLEFSKTVSSSSLVGFALGSINDRGIENELLPNFLTTNNYKKKDFIRDFIWRRFHLQGWDWCDIQPREKWTLEQISQFLTYLPFISETWQRATEWLQEHEYLYWHKTDARPYQLDECTVSAVDKLIKYDRPCTAIKCISSLRYHKINVDNDLCIRALIAAVSSQEDKHAVSSYEIV